MATHPHNDSSFVLRIWWERRHDGLVRWHGQVIHAGTRQSLHVSSLPELIGFMERWTGDLQPQPQGSEQLQASVHDAGTSD